MKKKNISEIPIKWIKLVHYNKNNNNKMYSYVTICFFGNTKIAHKKEEKSIE